MIKILTLFNSNLFKVKESLLNEYKYFEKIFFRLIDKNNISNGLSSITIYISYVLIKINQIILILNALNLMYTY